MDRRLLEYYERELIHLRRMGAEFAREFPNIAKRLSLEEFDCADPYVERLLEGFAFLAARVQLKFDSEFPRFTQAMLESVYPHYLAPTPSMAVVRFQPDLTRGELKEGYLVPRNTVLRTVGRGRAAACEYRTAHPVTLWPLEIVEAAYHTRDLGALDLPPGLSARAALRVRIGIMPGATLPISALQLSELVLHLCGPGELKMRLYEQVFSRAGVLVAQPAASPPGWREVIEDWRGAVGFEDEESMLPFDARSFQGYRLLKEYFSLPERFLFARVGGFAPAVAKCQGNHLDLIMTFTSADLQLEDQISARNVALFCTPAVNLFARDADRIHITDRREEYQVIPDRTRPVDFEVYQVRSVRGFGASAAQQQEFAPFYAARDVDHDRGAGSAFFSVHRVARTVSERERKQGHRSTSYAGSEVYVSLVDARMAPFDPGIRQLAVSTLCTNRDLPLHVAASGGGDESDFNWETGAPIRRANWVSGPTPPRPSWAEGDASWRLISHLCLNYLSLTDSDAKAGASALRELLRLYGDLGEPQIRKQVEGVRSLAVQRVTRRVPTPGPITFARGLELTLLLDDQAFEGSGVFVLASVLRRFFTRYVSINSFTETVLRTVERGEVMRWPATIGAKYML